MERSNPLLCPRGWKRAAGLRCPCTETLNFTASFDYGLQATSPFLITSGKSKMDADWLANPEP